MVAHDVKLLRRIPPFGVNAVLAVAVAAIVCIAIAAAQENGATAPDALAYALGVAVAAPLLVRRRWPLGGLLVSAGFVLLYHGLEYPAIGLGVPLAVALFNAALLGRLWPAAAVALVLELWGIGFRALEEGESIVSVIGNATVGDAALMAVVLLLGETLRTRRAWLAEVRARQRRTELEHEWETERRLDQERLRIAREMHDVLAHTIAVIGVQASVAADALPDSPDEAERPLQTIRDRVREAMGELRATIGVLREPSGAPAAPAPGLARLDDLVSMAAAAGVRMEVTVTGSARSLPPVVDLAAYRILQEAVTNVVRHADADRAQLEIAYEPGGVRVQVADDGRGGGPAPGGFGLAGVRERAAGIGGHVEAGPAPGGGFRVRAWLPTEPRALERVPA